MKKLFNASLLILGVCLISSCYTVFPVAKLNYNYDKRMTTTEELVAKNNVQIYHSAEEVPYDNYEILSYVRYRPFSIILIAPESKQQLKKFYKKAVVKANKLGGNGIIINNIGDFQVIRIPDIKKDSHDSIEMKSSVMTSTVLPKFIDGSIYKLDNKMQSKYVDMLEKEIKENIDDCKTFEESAFITTKINELAKYYDSIGKNDKSVSKKIEGLKKDLKEVEGKISKKLERKAKLEEAKAKGESRLNKLFKRE